MKSKIRTLTAIVALGIIGMTNINAISEKASKTNAEVVTESEEMLSLESWMIDESYWTSKTMVDTWDKEDSIAVESWMLDEELWK